MSRAAGEPTRAGERGAVSIKAVLTIFVCGVVVFLVIKFAPVYVEQREIIYKVDDLARVAALRGWKEDKISKDISKLNVEYNLPEGGINFVSRSDRGVQIAVNYQRNIDLLVTTYAWKVDHMATGKEL